MDEGAGLPVGRWEAGSPAPTLGTARGMRGLLLAEHKAGSQDKVEWSWASLRMWQPLCSHLASHLSF